ncbi:MAG TPA: lytic transglycosylase domain-containing protein [Gammaproteobacteria bacterium]|nr:lytic transglycosylase domain-containing protein [Gammaproteobacteria bacterium]
MRLFPLRKAPLAGLILLTLAVPPTTLASTDPELRRLLKDAIETESGFDDRFDAQVWLLDMSRRLEKFVVDPKTRIEMLKQVHYEATRANIEPELVLALIEVESRFDEFAISVAGARGLMQVMPFWLDEIGISDKNLFKIRTNLRMGCTILRYYMDMEPNDLGRALARYNGSLGRTIYPNKVIEALHRNWFKQ